MAVQLLPGISVPLEPMHSHSKASERYIHAIFSYAHEKWDGWVPIEYRRTGLDLHTQDEINKHLNMVYTEMDPSKRGQWKRDQDEFWATKPNALTTKSFYDILITGGWKCVECTLPKNPNWARRIQDLKEFGYTLSTDTKKYCSRCGGNKTHLILLPIPRYANEGNGYETWTPALRKRIVRILGGIDVYEAAPSAHCLPDHKFSEIRWDENTKADNPDSMTDDEIRQKFQLLTNQRNQQKREMCRGCKQTGLRPYPFGIKFYYAGGERWDDSIPRKGKAAEAGCVGCGWYDMAEWRKQLMRKLEQSS